MRIHLPACLWLSISDCIACCNFIIFGTEVNLLKLSNKREFRENNLGEDHTLLSGVNGYPPALPILLDRFGRNSVYEICPQSCSEFRISWKSVQRRECFSYGRKWNYNYVCTVKSCDVLAVKSSLLKSVNWVTQAYLLYVCFIAHLKFIRLVSWAEFLWERHLHF